MSGDMEDLFSDFDPVTNHFYELNPSSGQYANSEYFDTLKFNSDISCNEKDFSMISFNVRSMKCNGDNFIAFLANVNLKFDVICLTETWFDQNYAIGNYFPDYNGFHSHRQDGMRGGGSSIFIKKYFNAKLIPELKINCEFLECIFVKILMGSKILNVGSCYRPPNSNYENFSEAFMGKLENLNLTRDSCIIGGDFNLDFLKYDSDSNVSNFYDGVSSLYLMPSISKPTRVTDNSASIIDNFLVSNIRTYTAGLFSIDLSDHFPIFLVCKNIFETKPKKSIEIKYRVLNDRALDSLKYSFENLNFDEVLYGSDYDQSFIILHEKILQTYNQCCPIKTKIVSYKDSEKPWITNDIKRNMRKREMYFKLSKRNLMNVAEYNRFRNFVTNEIRLARKDYYYRLFESKKMDIRKTWSSINKLLGKNKSDKNCTIREILLESGESTSDASVMAEEFNSYFSSVGRNIAESLPQTNISHSQYLNNFSSQNSLFFRKVSAEDVSNAIVSLKNKSSNILTYPNKILKLLKDTLSPILAFLINETLKIGYFPQPLKNAQVIPIFKSGNRNLMRNYRPISLLSSLSKIYEKIVYSQLYSFLEKYNLLSSSQFGFRRKKSTTQAILDSLLYITENLDSGKTVVSLFLDFCKAFDSVDHEILISKLSTYGVRGVACTWFRNYLTGRTQYVQINGINSSSRVVSHGVPQGSTLGPLTFLIFINDFINSSDFFKLTLFADDSTFSSSFDRNQTDIANHLNSELENIWTWLLANKLKLNAEKSKFVVFSYRRDVEVLPIRIGSSDIDEDRTAKFLGINIDSKLNFESHVRFISSKISKSIGIIFKLNNFLPVDILEILYQSLVQPYLSYAIEIWYCAPDYIRNKIFILQKKAIRAVHSLPYNAHTNNYFKLSGILKIVDQFKLAACSQIYISLNSNSIPFLRDKIYFSYNFNRYPTRFNSRIINPLCRLAKTQNSFLYQAITEWNNIPLHIKTSKTIHKFKFSLKTHYLSSY